MTTPILRLTITMHISHINPVNTHTSGVQGCCPEDCVTGVCEHVGVTKDTRAVAGRGDPSPVRSRSPACSLSVILSGC